MVGSWAYTMEDAVGYGRVLRCVAEATDYGGVPQ